VINNLTVGAAAGMTFTDVSLQGWIDLPVAMTYQLIGSAS
jgi:hypothetical protein